MKSTKAYYLITLLHVALLVSTAGYSSCFAQENEINVRRAGKIDAYDHKELRGHDEQMRLWGAADEFAKEPETSRLFIIAYGNLPGRARRYATRAKNYLVSTHGINSSRVITVNGGFRTESSIEIWIVAAETQEPLPMPNGTFEQYINVAWKFDEYSLDGWWFGDYGSCCEREPERLDGFAAVLKSNPKYRGIVIVHKGTTNCETCLTPGTEFRFAQDEKKYLVTNQQITSSRISVVTGGKDYARIELWLVPDGANLPKTKNKFGVKQ